MLDKNADVLKPINIEIEKLTKQLEPVLNNYEELKAIIDGDEQDLHKKQSEYDDEIVNLNQAKET
jgi:hypothetical protein